MAANVLAYFAEGESGVKSRRTARCQAPGARAKGSGWGLGAGDWRWRRVLRTPDSCEPRASFMGFNPDPSPQRLAPDRASLHDVLETKGVACLASECLNGPSPSNEES